MKFTQNNQLSIIHLFREYTNCKFIHKKTLTGCKPQYFSSKMFGYFWYGICLPHTEHMSWDGYITSILEELGINWLYNRRYFYCLQVRGMYACMICIMCMYFCRCTCRNWYWRDLVCPKMERPAGSVALPEIATKKRWIYGWIHWSPTKVAWTWTLDVSKCPSPAHRCPCWSRDLSLPPNSKYHHTRP